MIFKLTVTRIKWFISFPRIDLKSVQQIKILKRIAKIEHSRKYEIEIIEIILYTVFLKFKKRDWNWNINNNVEILFKYRQILFKSFESNHIFPDRIFKICLNLFN